MLLGTFCEVAILPKERKADSLWLEVWKKLKLLSKKHQANFLTIRWECRGIVIKLRR